MRILTSFAAAWFSPRSRGPKIGAAKPKITRQHFNFLQRPALIIRQRVARLTPKNFADADIPISRGPFKMLVTRLGAMQSLAHDAYPEWIVPLVSFRRNRSVFALVLVRRGRH